MEILPVFYHSSTRKKTELRGVIRYTFYSVQSEFDSVQSADIAQRVKHLFASDLNLPMVFPIA